MTYNNSVVDNTDVMPHVGEPAEAEEPAANLTVPQQICELVLGPPLNKLHQSFQKALNFLPYILVTVLAEAHPTLAIWLSFAVAELLALLNYFYSTFHPNCSSWYWFDQALGLSLLGLGIANAVVFVPSTIIRNVPTSAMLLAIAISILIGQPFTKQFAMKSMSPEKLALPQVKRNLLIMALLWLAVFLVMVVSGWCSLLFVQSSNPVLVKSNKTAYNILAVWIPIILPILAGQLTEFLKNNNKVSDSNTNGKDDGTGADGTGTGADNV